MCQKRERERESFRKKMKKNNRKRRKNPEMCQSNEKTETVT